MAITHSLVADGDPLVGAADWNANHAVLTTDVTLLAWPIGSVFIAVVSTSPATLLGGGTWAAIGAGRVLIGVDAGDPDFDTAEETGGAKTHGHSDNLSHAGAAVGNHIVTQPADHTGVITHNHVQDAHNHTQDAHAHTQASTTTSTGSTSNRLGTADTTSTAQNTGNATATNQAATATNQAPAGAVAQLTHSGTAVDAHGVTQPNAHTAHGAINHMPPFLAIYMWKRTA